MALTLEQVCIEAGLEKKAVEYLTNGQGFTKIMQIAKVGITEDEFMEKVFKPYEKGVKGEVEYKAERALVMEAAFRCLHTHCVRVRNAREEAARPKPPEAPVTESQGGDPLPRKAPRTLAPGIWAKQIK